MKKTFVTLTGIILVMFASAQEYKIAKGSGRLEISEVNHVLIEGHGGSDIVFTLQNGDTDDGDERAKGLRAISALGLEDNTGLGLSAVVKGDIIEVNQLKKTDGPRVKILVPKGVVVSCTHSSPFGDEIEIRNFAGEIHVSTVHNGVVLSNTTGPISVKTVHGGIEASLGSALTSRVTLESVHGHVDVALPVAAKANLTMDTKWGEVLVDPSFKIELERTGDLTKYNGTIKGTLNGGGIELSLKSQHNNVYLRKK